MEDYSRELYKLNKVFTSKAKQKSREKDKEKVVGGPRRDMKDSNESMELQEFAPLKLATLALDGVKNFQVSRTCVFEANNLPFSFQISNYYRRIFQLSTSSVILV